MNDFPPWLSITHKKNTIETVIREFSDTFFSLNIPSTATPCFTILVGKKNKSDILRQLIKNRDNGFLADTHGQVHLWTDNSTLKSRSPTIYLDYELQVLCESQWIVTHAPGPELTLPVEWTSSSPTALNRRSLGRLLCGRVLAPLSDTTCYFQADLGGSRAVAAFLAEQAALPAVSDMPTPLLPTVLVVVNTTSRAYDCFAAEKKLLHYIIEILKTHYDISDAETYLKRHFKRIQVLGLPKHMSNLDRSNVLRTRLAAIRQESLIARRAHGADFTFLHLHSFAVSLLKNFCGDHQSTFSFSRSSRPGGLQPNDLEGHLTELLAIIPSEIWLFHLVSPLLASALTLANYPPGSHAFPARWLFHQLYEYPIMAAIYNSCNQPQTLGSFFDGVLKDFEKNYEDLLSGKYLNAADLHLHTLQRLRGYLSLLRSNKTCLSCLFGSVEKGLVCAHTICDQCIQIYGRKLPTERYAFQLEHCLLCAIPHAIAPFRLPPPTAGARVLCLDGGGIKGISSLAILQKLESKMEPFEAPLCDYFDFVCGTSAGGLSVLGIFLMRWSVADCMDKFEKLAEKTFYPSSKRASVFSRLQHLAISYLRDWQYSAIAIEQAFQTTFGTDVQMFNPLCNDTKVAVTSTTTNGAKACIFSNYNGVNRPENIGYNIVRAADAESDIYVSQAAKCTSAAPWFFKPITLKSLGTFQDGGLRHNNPLRLAIWEMKYLWPKRSVPDFALSIGTGTTRSKFSIGMEFPVKRFLSRSYDAFMESMNGEEIYHEVLNSIPEKDRYRFHRLNLVLKHPEPQLDDVSSMYELKEAAYSYIENEPSIKKIVNAMLASMFYFEFDGMPVWKTSSYLCTGHIYCRLPLSPQGQRTLYMHLFNTSSYFLVFGQPFACVERVGKTVPPFRRQVQFLLDDLEDVIGITLTGITSKPKTISGLPRKAREIIIEQNLDAPFGRSNHSVLEKPLPQLPLKRKFQFI